MSIEAMKQALEALENSVDLVVEDAYNAEQLYGKYPSRQAKVGGLKLLADEHQKAITSLRQAIKELESQEPVCPECKAEVLYECVACSRNNYPPQRTWVGLTDEEIDKTHETQVWDARRSYARAIEAKLKEKNT